MLTSEIRNQVDRAAAKEKVAAFLDGQTYTADQIRFVSYIIDHLTENGSLDPGLLYERPFTDIDYRGPDGIFTEEQTSELVNMLVTVNKSIEL